MSGVSATLELDISAAESAIDDLDAKLEAVTQGFGQSLADAVSTVSGPPVEIMAEVTTDVAQVEAELASLDAPPIDVAVDADTAQVEAELASLPEPAPIEVEVSAPGADEAAASLDDLGASADSASVSVSGMAQAIGAVGLAGALGSAVSQFAEASGVVATTDQVISNLGGSAGITSESVQALATRIQSYSGISDEAIIAAAGLVAQMGAVTNAAGEGNDAFDRAIELAADMSTVFGTDMTSAARQLGRALADPERGISRLERSIGPLDEAVKANIITMAQSGDVMGAQAALLDALEEKVGGAAAAYGDSFGGQVARAGEALGEFSEDVGAAAATMAGPLLGAVIAMGEGFQRLPDGVQEAIAAMVAMGLAAGSLVLALRAASVAAGALGFEGVAASLGAVNPAFLLLAATIGVAIVVMHDYIEATGEIGPTAEQAATGARQLTALFSEQGAIIPALRERIVDLSGSYEQYATALDVAGVSAGQFAEFVANTDPSNFFTALGDLSPTAQSVAVSLSELAAALQEESRVAIEAAIANGQISPVMADMATAAAGQGSSFAATGTAVTNYAAILAGLPGVMSPAEAAISAVGDAARGMAPDLAGAIDAVSNAAGGLAGFVLATDPRQVIDNLRQMIQAFTDFQTNIEVIGEVSETVALALGQIGPEGAAAFAQGLRLLPPAATLELEALIEQADAAGVGFAEVMTGFAEGGIQGATDALNAGAGAVGEAGNKVGTAATEGTKEGIKGMPIAAADGAQAAAKFLAAQKESARAAGWEFGWGASEGTGEGTAGMGPAAQGGVNAAVNAMRGGAGFAFAGGQVLGTLFTTGTVAGIAAGTGAVQASGGNTAAALLRGGVGPALTGGMSVGRLFSTGASVGVAAGGGGVSQSAGSVVQSAVARASEVAKSGGYGVGQALGSGIAQGIGSQISSIVSAAVNAVQQAVAAARDAAEVGSPSRLFAREVGAPMGEGIAVGLLSAESSVVAAAERITRAASVGAVSAIDIGGSGSGRGSALSIVQNIDARGADPAAVGAAAAAGAESALARHRRTVDVRLAQR